MVGSGLATIANRGELKLSASEPAVQFEEVEYCLKVLYDFEQRDDHIKSKELQVVYRCRLFSANMALASSYYIFLTHSGPYIEHLRFLVRRFVFSVQ